LKVLAQLNLFSDQSNHDAASGKPLPEEKIFKDDELMNMIDPILASQQFKASKFSLKCFRFFIPRLLYKRMS
jgi:hypothetical protein